MDSFVFYTHYAKKMKKLPPEQAASLLYAICDYVENGTEPDFFDSATDMCFSFIRTQLDKDIAKYEDTCKKRAEAGRRGAAATNSKRQSQAKPANAEKSEPEPVKTEQEKQAQEQKKKAEPKKVKYGEFVSMTEAEYDKLAAEYGDQMTKRMIEVLDNYKGSKGKTYKSDYRAILNWVVERVKEEYAKRGETGHGGTDANRVRDNQFNPSKGFKRAEPD